MTTADITAQDPMEHARALFAAKADGLIEAISVEHSPTFALGVQWHPEWQVLDNPNYLKIFQAFGAACRQRAARRNQR